MWPTRAPRRSFSVRMRVFAARAATSSPHSQYGAVATIVEGVSAVGVQELMIASQIFDHRSRLRSYEITASLFSG